MPTRLALALAIVALGLGACTVDTGAATSPRSPTSSTAPAPTGATTTSTVATPIESSFSDLIERTALDLQAFWSDVVPVVFEADYSGPAGGLKPYRPSVGAIPTCGGEDLADRAANNAFYCPSDDYIAWDDEGLFPHLIDQFGEFSVALVLAHEWGHLVQDRISFDAPSIVRELQADCLAGAWAGDLAKGGSELVSLEPGDIDAAVAGYLLFRDPPQATPDDPSAHGSTFDRVGAFLDGFEVGVTLCAQYGDGELPLVVEIGFTEIDAITGGDLPFAEVAGTMAGSLDAFWAETLPAIYGFEYESPSGLAAYDPARQVPVCGGTAVEVIEQVAFYCEPDDYLAWDEPTLFVPLYQAFGDVAPAVALSTEWAERSLVLAGAATTGMEPTDEVDCLTGAWLRWIFDGNNLPLRLSAGDLDEAVGSLLVHPAPTSDMAAFVRVQALQEGFFAGPAVCTQSS